MVKIVLEPEPTRQDRTVLTDMIRQFNQQFFQPSEWQSVAVFAKDEAGSIVGGALGEIGCDWLYLRILVVQENLRRQGIGSKILTAFEHEGHKQECVGVHLETLEFSARTFYEKHGYTMFAVQKNYPKGYSRYFMERLFSLA